MLALTRRGLLVTFCVLPVTGLAGVRLPIDPISFATDIVVARIVRYDGDMVVLDIQETLKGSLPKGQTKGRWMPTVPDGCDTKDCVQAVYRNPPPRPPVGALLITMAVNQRPGGQLLVYQEFASSYSDQKRTEILGKLKSPRK